MKTDKQIRQEALNKMVDKCFYNRGYPVRDEDVRWSEPGFKDIEWTTRSVYNMDQIQNFARLVNASTVTVEGGDDETLLIAFLGVTFPWER